MDKQLPMSMYIVQGIQHAAVYIYEHSNTQKIDSVVWL